MVTEMLHDVFKLRTCNLDLTTERISLGKYKACLQYHINNCKGPCIGLQSEKVYMQNIDHIKKILSGRTAEVIGYFKELMNKYAQDLEFEKAQEIKENIEQLEKYQSKSLVFNPKLKNIEVYNIINEENIAFVNFMKIIEGKIIQSYVTHIIKKLNEKAEDILIHFILEIKENKQFTLTNTQEILVPFEINLELDNLKFKVPKIGDKKKLLELSLKNLEYYRKDYYKNKAQTDPNLSSLKLLEKVKIDLRLKHLPIHIECFDNSNLQGSNPVSSCVVFKYAKPSKKDYKKFSIKTVKGIDDYKTMQEVIDRRYKQAIKQGEKLPDLIVIDGGKGQLSAAVESLKRLGIYNKVDLISIAKRLEEIYKPDDNYPLFLKKSSYTLKLIQRIRDEAHRFGIEYHRKRRTKQMLSSEILDIPGIGLKTYQKLLDYFSIPENIKNATIEELKKVVNSQKAQKIFNYFHYENGSKNNKNN